MDGDGAPSSSSSPIHTRQELTEEQKRRIQRNKEKAQERRKLSKPYHDKPGKGPEKPTTCPVASSSRDPQPGLVVQSQVHNLHQPWVPLDSATPFRDSHAGFMYSEEDGDVARRPKSKLVEEPGM